MKLKPTVQVSVWQKRITEKSKRKKVNPENGTEGL